ncbi:MAG: aldo/keto reductase [Candidatus Omnitrophica bacterium]|nr:aldo/keto reductase [Candidatus Omnitrophota bacterium]
MSDPTKALNRRSFVQLGAGLGLAAAAPLQSEAEESAPAQKMKYRTLGKTGLKVSEVSLGTYGFNNSGLLEEALDSGMNLINTCADYQHGAAEEAVGRVMKTRRKDAILFTGWSCSDRTSKADLLKSIDASLKRLQTDYIDIVKTHCVNDPAVLDNGAQYEAFEEAKKAGKVGFLGISAHGGNRDEILLKALEKKVFDVFQFKFNFMEQPSQEKMFEEAQKQEIGIITFKCQAGKREKEIKDLEQKGLTQSQAAVRWSLAQPGVHSVCVAVNNFQDIKVFKEAVLKQFGRAEDQLLRRYAQAVDHDYCRYCSTCEPSCPHHVAVADIMRFCMYFKYYKMEKEAMRLYADLPAERCASVCKDCPGHCLQACPHQRPVRDGLLEADYLLA